VSEQIFYLTPAPPPHPDRREHTERRAQRASGNARHHDRSKIRAVRRKMNHRATPGNVERTGDQSALGNKQRTPIDRNRAGNVGIVRHLEDSSELVTDYSLDHIPRWHDGYCGAVKTNTLQFLDDVMQLILVIEKGDDLAHRLVEPRSAFADIPHLR
jgi:hypothetical protein